MKRRLTLYTGLAPLAFRPANFACRYSNRESIRISETKCLDKIFLSQNETKEK